MINVVFIGLVICCAFSIWQSAVILKMAKDVKEFFKLDDYIDEVKNGNNLENKE